MNEEWKNNLKEGLNKININIEDKKLEDFYKYMNLLLEWNEKINLTAIIDPKDIILKHFIDSLTISKYINENDRIIDVGTGAGFPGIPLSIINEKSNITLMDSLNKRINFLKEVKSNLNLKNVETIHARAEDIGKDKKYREKFDIATSRAVANLSTLSEYLIPLVKINGKIICMKGNDVEKEVADAKFAIKELGGKIIDIDKFYLPETDIERNIIVIEKIKETPKQYPRKAGIPTKQPLK